jgi:hypothetical protein
MNLIELNRALRQLRLAGIATVLETRLHQAQAEPGAILERSLIQERVKAALRNLTGSL